MESLCLHACHGEQRVTRVEEKQILLEGGESIPYGYERVGDGLHAVQQTC